jgi:hypothetical protein
MDVNPKYLYTNIINLNNRMEATKEEKEKIEQKQQVKKSDSALLDIIVMPVSSRNE